MWQSAEIILVQSNKRNQNDEWNDAIKYIYEIRCREK